jgi:hypothetical protein
MTEQFFDGFVAALRLNGVQFVKTADGVHHDRFRGVAQVLERLQEDGADGMEELPLLFRPTPSTGFYGELDDALIRMQDGMGSSPNPYYPGLKLALGEDQARDVLLEFSESAREILDQLAKVWVETPEPATLGSTAS